MFGLAPTPRGASRLGAEAGDSTSRYFLRPKLSRELTITGRTPGGRPVPSGTRTGTAAKKASCRPKTAICDRAPLRRPPRRAQLRCCSAGYGAVSEKQSRPTVFDRAPGKFYRFNSSLKRYISLLRRGARWFERTGLKPAGLRLRRGGAPKGRLIGLTGEKNCLYPRALGNHSR